MNPKRIVIIGPESTGKSTLSEQLAQSLHTLWVPEYARSYLKDMQRPYNEDDLVQIARGQLHSEDELAMKAEKLLICDTDLHVVKVWSESKYGYCHKWILDQIAVRRYDLYLLTNIDIKWQYDPLREHPEEGQRKYFYNIYRDIVQQSGLPWTDISGDAPARLQTALASIHRYLLVS